MEKHKLEEQLRKLENERHKSDKGSEKLHQVLLLLKKEKQLNIDKEHQIDTLKDQLHEKCAEEHYEKKSKYVRRQSEVHGLEKL